MDASTIIGIVGLLAGLSGWAAFGWQVHISRRDAVAQLATNLDSLDRLIGQWMDRITDITELSGTFEETARRIEKFNQSRGGFEVQVNQALQQIPDEPRFNELREDIKEFKEDALEEKTGLIGHLTDTTPPPLPDDWRARREDALRALRSECAALQRRLEEESGRLRS